MQRQYQPSSNRVASRRLTRAVTPLTRAGRQLESASQATPDHFHRKRLHFFASGLRELSLPLSRIASRLENGGEQMNCGELWHRPTQTDVLISKLREARAERRGLELSEIMRLGIAQHGARMKELRDRGFKIINELESIKGVLHSRYWLIFDPERDGGQQ